MVCPQNGTAVLKGLISGIDKQKVSYCTTVVLLIWYKMLSPDDARNIFTSFLGIFPAALVASWPDPVPGSIAIAGSRTKTPVEPVVAINRSHTKHPVGFRPRESRVWLDPIQLVP